MDGAGTAGARAAEPGLLPPGESRGTLLQPASIPTISAAHHTKELAMTLLLIEALGAGLLFIGIIWWTMFSGRPDGDPPSADAQDKDKNS
jgi:hypothetical protein